MEIDLEFAKESEELVMKKIITTIVLTLVLTLGMGVTVFAGDEKAEVVSATDSGGSDVSASVSFTMVSMYTLTGGDFKDIGNLFWDLGETDGKALAAYYGCDEYDIAMRPYSGGILDLSGTNVSADNPITITFSIADEYGYTVKAGGPEWLYVIQKLSDGTYKLIRAESTADGTITARFTESGTIVFDAFDLARESFDYKEILQMNGVQSAVDAAGNPVAGTITVTELDSDRKMVAATKALQLLYEIFGDALDYSAPMPFVTADVKAEGFTVSADNPVTVTFSVEGISEGEPLTVLHKKDDGSWENLPGTTGNGTVTVTFTSLSPVVFVRTSAATAEQTPTEESAQETTAAPEATTPATTENNGETTNAAASALVSPKTGEENVFGPAVFGAAICIVGFAWVYGKKKVS